MWTGSLVNGKVLLNDVNKEVLRDDIGLSALGNRSAVLNHQCYPSSTKIVKKIQRYVQGKLLSFIPYSKH